MANSTTTLSTKEAELSQWYRPREKKNHSTEASRQLAEFWTAESDDKLITFFKTLPGYTELRDSMVKAYPKHAILLTRERCRTRVFSLVRCGLRKLANMRTKMKPFGVPEMVTMNHERNHNFLYYKDNKEIKERLLEFFRTDKVSITEFR